MPTPVTESAIIFQLEKKLLKQFLLALLLVETIVALE
jgi:hypothetical protein